MIIQHNIMAINSHNQLGVNNTNLSKNLEKLSSGYRINRAADDASGLAVSEKMRAQITGLNRAIMNAQDGASLIQTAEGALTEVHSMLNRMVELAEQSANGTYEETDRLKIESELDALKEEIDRISMATNFNGLELLNGDLQTTPTMVAGTNFTETILAGATDDLSYAEITSWNPPNSDTVVPSQFREGTGTVTFSMSSDSNGKYQITATASDIGGNTITATFDIVNTAAIDGKKGEIIVDLGGFGSFSVAVKQGAGTTTNAIALDSIMSALTTAVGSITYDLTAGTGKGLTMQVGDTADSFNKITVSVDDMSSKGLGIENITMSTQDGASEALSLVKSAIERVSVNRGNLGALQNRLEHTIKNLTTTTENLTASESRIRDVDMAKEMMQFTKNNVLAQAAQAMLAQANMQPQQVLQLLR